MLREYRYAAIAVLLFLVVGMGARWLIAMLPEEVDRSDVAGAERGLELEPEPAEPIPERAEPDAPTGEPRTWVLDLDSSSRSGERAATPGPTERLERDDAGATAPRRAGPLPKGRADILFTVQDGSGRPVSNVVLILQSLEPAGGEERAVTGNHGEARFIDLAAGTYSYRAEARDRPGGAQARIRLDKSERKRVTVRLEGIGLPIMGRVRDQKGQPVAGVKISAVRHRFASATSGGAHEESSPRTAHSRADGSFEIRGLTEGEYDVRTSASERYAPVEAIVQAGDTSVELILMEGLRVLGSVTNTRGEPLAHVWVGLRARRNVFAHTDVEGSFELAIIPDFENPDLTLRFYLQGYEEMLLALPVPEPENPREVRLDVQLRASENAARVAGVVETERGDPVGQATIVLGSPQLETHYQSMTDADGNFSITGVEIGRGYQLRVLTDGSFLDYSRSGINVREEGLSLEIVLEHLPTGRLTGRMIDANENPIPGFRLWLMSRAAIRGAVPITGDDRGYFELREAPAGDLVFDTRSSPRLVVDGISLPVGGEAEVLLVLDWGDEAMTGRVVDDRGDPVGGAQVSLSWTYESGDSRSTSTRSTRTDPGGAFRFTQLGPGEHRLHISAEGYHAVQEYRDVGRYAEEVEVRLESNAP